MSAVADAGATASTLIAAAAAFRGGAAFAVIGQPRMPPLVGPNQAVGCRIARVRTGESDGACRAKIFYPAAIDTGVDAPYCTDGRETSDGMAGLVGFRQLGLSFLLAHLANAPSGCVLDAPPSEGSFPLFVYSHGYGGNMDMGTYFLREIAAAGAIVCAIEHTGGLG